MTRPLQIRDCMKRSVISILETAKIRDAAALFTAYHIGSLPVINETGHLLGIVQLRDLLTLVMPDFIQLIQDFDFVGDFGAVEARVPDAETLDKPVKEIMQHVAYIEETSGLLRAFAMLHHQKLQDLPVVDADGRLIGIASRVDIGAALVSTWGKLTEE